MAIDLEAVRRRAEALKRQQGIATADPEPEYADELIPEVETTRSRSLSDQDREIDEILNGVDIIEAYRRWCGKMEPQVGSRRENIMISCPFPGHADTVPSAAINLDTEVFNCYACDAGGDKYTIAAIHFGLDTPTRGSDFPRLRQMMIEDLGYSIGSARQVIETVEESTPPLEAVPPPPYEEDSSIPVVDWRTCLPKETFLYKWMQECTEKTFWPENYFFALGLQLVGLTASNDVTLRDQLPVKPNLFVCLLGRTGDRKTSTVRLATKLLRLALPYDEDNHVERGGVKIPGYSNSPEVLIQSFDRFDEAAGERIPVTGLIEFPELKSLILQSQRKGSNIIPTLMQFADGDEWITSQSLSTGFKEAKRAMACGLTTTQIDSIRRLLTREDNDSGFINRWLFMLGEPKPEPIDLPPPADVETLVGDVTNLRSWCAGGHTVDPYGDTRETFVAYRQRCIDISESKMDMDAIYTRTDLLYKKMVLLFCINENLDAPTIDLLRRVDQVWPALMAGYERLSGLVGVPELDACIDDIQKYILKYAHQHEGQTPKKSDCQRIYGKKYSTAIFNMAVRQAIEAERFEEFQIKPKGKGRPSKHLRVSGGSSRLGEIQ